MSDIITQKYAQVWALPVSESSFCGEDVSFEASFEELRLEVEKDSSLHGTAATDWEQVLQYASTILATQSKDIWALCYAIRASFALEGVPGCCAALTAANTLWEAHWDEMFPTAARPQRRAAPFAWLAARFESLLPADAFPKCQADTLSLFKTELAKLQTLVDEKLGDAAPSFLTTSRAVPDVVIEENTISHLLAPPAPQPAAQQAPTTQGATTQQRAAEPVATVVPAATAPIPAMLVPTSELLKAIDGDGRVPPAILPQLLRTVQEQAQQLAVHYLTNNIGDWRVYFLHRAAIWGTVNQLPQTNSAGVTQVRAIPRDRILQYEGAVENRQYAAILPQLERSAGKAPFWLDGHHMVARCLEGIGAKPAHSILCMSLTELIAHYPDILHLKFYDGTPFASEATTAWITQLLQRQSGEATTKPWQKPMPGGGEGENADLEERLENALLAYTEQGFAEGLALLGAAPAGKNRTAVRHGLLKARYCMAAGKPKAAAHLLKALYEQLATWGMLDWEPELTASIVSLLCATKQVQKAELPTDVIRLLHWLHLDTALEIIKE